MEANASFQTMTAINDCRAGGATLMSEPSFVRKPDGRLGSETWWELLFFLDHLNTGWMASK